MYIRRREIIIFVGGRWKGKFGFQTYRWTLALLHFIEKTYVHNVKLGTGTLHTGRREPIARIFALYKYNNLVWWLK